MFADEITERHHDTSPLSVILYRIGGCFGKGFGLVASVSARIVKEGVLCHHGYVPIHP
jgi:hypothetical protein